MTGFLISGGVAALIAAGPASAQATQETPDASQQVAGTAAPTAASATTSEDIIVTAEKRPETLIDVPQSISVISGATLEAEQASTFQDYLKLVPGLQIEQSEPGNSRLILRGLNTGGVAATVAVYEDETPFGSSTGQANGAILAGDFDTFDVARIEVLRGPQGTLYGASSLGGVLKFVTNAPDPTEFAARARGGVETVQGGDLSYYGNAMVNVPLGDTLAFRASGTYRNNGGFIDSIGTGGSRDRDNINGSQVYGGRASLLFKPSDRFSIRLNALVQNIDVDAPTVEESDPNTLKTLYGDPTQSIFVSPFVKTAYRNYNGTVDWGLGFADLVSSTSYSTTRQSRRDDETNLLSGTIGLVFQVPGPPTQYLPNELYLSQLTSVKKFTQEVRLSSSHGRLFDWVVGGYYTHEDGLIFQQYVDVEPGTLTPITTLPAGTINLLGGGTAATTLPTLAIVNAPSTYSEIAGFANATVHFGPHFDLDFGGRYSHNRQNASEALDGLLVGGSANLLQPSSEGVFTYSVAPKIKFGDNVSLYGRVAKGFRPGGPNPSAPGAPADTLTYKSDSTVNYEIGLKTQTPDRKFAFEIAGYHIDWSRIQLLTTIQTDAGPFSFNGNGGSAKSDGVEATATIRPISGFEVAINSAITNARLTEDTAVGGLKGDHLPYTPRYSIGIDDNYEWTLAGSTKAVLGASLRFLSKQPGPFDTTRAAVYQLSRLTPTIPSYAVIDLRAGLDFRRFSVEVYAKNINNADGKLSELPIGGFPNEAVATGVIRPRTVGLSVTAGF